MPGEQTNQQPSATANAHLVSHRVHRKLVLELDRMELENKLLVRKIELLDKAQEYRCCPADEKVDGPQ